MARLWEPGGHGARPSPGAGHWPTEPWPREGLSLGLVHGLQQWELRWHVGVVDKPFVGRGCDLGGTVSGQRGS